MNILFRIHSNPKLFTHYCYINITLVARYSNNVWNLQFCIIHTNIMIFRNIERLTNIDITVILENSWNYITVVFGNIHKISSYIIELILAIF